jgi:hypothetical protein
MWSLIEKTKNKKNDIVFFCNFMIAKVLTRKNYVYENTAKISVKIILGGVGLKTISQLSSILFYPFFESQNPLIMKKYISIIVLFLLSFNLNSCAEAEKLLDVKIPTTITVSIPVVVQQGADAFSETVNLSIDNSDTHDYLNKIKEVKIESLSYKFVNFHGDSNGTVDAAFSVDNEILVQNNVTIKVEADKGTSFKVDNLTHLNKIANSLKNGHSVKAKFSGTSVCPNESMNFEVRITMKVKIIANPL